MASNKIRTSIRIPESLYKKMVYISEMNCWSLNSEIDQLIKELIIEFEAEHGEIEVPELYYNCRKDE